MTKFYRLASQEENSIQELDELIDRLACASDNDFLLQKIENLSIDESIKISDGLLIRRIS